MIKGVKVNVTLWAFRLFMVSSYVVCTFSILMKFDYGNIMDGIGILLALSIWLYFYSYVETLYEDLYILEAEAEKGGKK